MAPHEQRSGLELAEGPVHLCASDLDPVGRVALVLATGMPAERTFLVLRRLS